MKPESLEFETYEDEILQMLRERTRSTKSLVAIPSVRETFVLFHSLLTACSEGRIPSAWRANAGNMFSRFLMYRQRGEEGVLTYRGGATAYKPIRVFDRYLANGGEFPSDWNIR